MGNVIIWKFKKNKLIKCRYTEVQKIIKRYGYDWTNLILNNVNFEQEDLRNVMLPNDIELFQRIKAKSLYKTKLPKREYSQYNFNDVLVFGAEFTEDSIFSKDTDVFQKVLKKTIEKTVLPGGDYSKHNFNGVKIGCSKFTKDSIFSEDKNVFQIIYNKTISYTVLPQGDYSDYNFNGVYLKKLSLQKTAYSLTILMYFKM